MNEKKIRIGVLGCANIAKKLIIPNIINSEDFELSGVASRDQNKSMHFANKFGCKSFNSYLDLISSNEIDAIYIPLPTGLHFEWALESLNHGKHVLCEKSLAVTPNQVKDLIFASKKNKKVLFENFMFPYHKQIQYVQNKLDENFIGDLRLFKSTFCFPIFDINTNIRYKKTLGGGSLLDAGAYTVMAAQIFMGSNIDVTFSHLVYNGEVDFHGTAILKNSNNVIGNLYFGFDNFYQNSIELYGTKGLIIMQRAFTAKEDFKPKILLENDNSSKEVFIPECNQAELMLADFSRLIKNNLFTEFHEIMEKQSDLLYKFIDER